MPNQMHRKPSKVASSAPLPWWQTGVVYQIYVRSFFDSNGDGVGDLRGVITKLDYIKDLGVDIIWLSPVTVSANADWGYDVVDYYNIDPTLGTMADYEELLAKATKLGLKVLMDLVPNHTSVEHPWFLNAKTSKQAKYRDYYIWGNPKPDGRPPNNWRAYAGGGCWEYHAPTGQYYLHSYFKPQADLNWRNPAVVKEFEKIMRFWLDHGVAGFRLDVFNSIIKDIQLRDNPKATKADGIESMLLGQRKVHNLSQPEAHVVTKRWRKIANEYDAVLLGETAFVFDIPTMAQFYGQHDEIQLIMNLGFLHSGLSAQEKRPIIEETERVVTSPDWPVWMGSNHDEKRYPSSWGEGKESKIRCATLMLLGLRGTPILYYGDEFGMERVFIAPWRMKDPRGLKNWPVQGGRDRFRTPMPWKNQLGAGFTKEDVRPWLPYGDLRVRSVEAQNERTDSTLQFTKDLIALRKANPDLSSGTYETLPSAESVWAWKRGRKTAVAINLSDYHHEIKHVNGVVALATLRDREGERVNGLLALSPWEGVIVSLD